MEFKDDENLGNEEVNEIKVNEIDTSEEVLQEPSKNNKIVVSFLATFLIIAVIITFVVMTVIPLVSSKEKFFKISQNAGAEIGDMIDDFGDSVFGEILTTNSDEKLQISTNLDLTLETQDQELLDVIYGFKNLKLRLDQDKDSKNNYMASNVEVLVNDEEFITIDMLEDAEHVALKSEGISDKYLRADKDNLSTVWERLNLSGPEQLGMQSEVLEKLQLTKADRKELGNTFKRAFIAVKKLYTNGDFTEGTETVSYNSVEKELSYVDLKLTSKKLNDSVIAILEQLQKETKTLDIFVDMLNGMNEAYATMGYENPEWTREELLTFIGDMLTQIRDFEVSEEDGMLLRVYYSGWDLTPMGFAMFNLPADEVYEFYYADAVNKLITDKENGYYEYSDQMQEYVDVVSTVDKVNTHNLEIRYMDYTTGEVLEEYTERYTITVDYADKNFMKLNIKEATGVIDYTLSGEIVGNEQILKLVMNDVYAEGETNKVVLTISLQRDAEFENKVLVEGEYVDLNEASDEEVNATITDVQAKWDTFAKENETKINQFSTIVGAYMTMFMPYDPYMYGDYSDLVLEDAQG